MRNKAHIQNLKAQLKKEFDMKDLKEAKKILNIETVKTKVYADSNYPKRIMFSRC